MVAFKTLSPCFKWTHLLALNGSVDIHCTWLYIGNIHSCLLYLAELVAHGQFMTSQSAMPESTTLTRRQFIVSASLASGGLALGVLSAEADPSATPNAPWDSAGASGDELSAWIEIHRDDTVIIRGPTPEIGNGSM